MSDIGSGPDFRIRPKQGGLDAMRPRGAPARDSGDRPSAGGGGPFDLDAAMQRLRALLVFDGEGGPRDGVARRGFYLNILV
jgi:hypothetical protein